MFRKHTRRAAKAAFAISFGVALLIGLSACGGGGGGGNSTTASTTSTSGPKPKIIIGSKGFGESYILEQLYGQALKAKGFPVTFKGNFGESELANKAIKSGKLDMYPEYTGVIVLDLAKAKFPKTAEATYAAAKKFEQTQGLTLLNPTPFEDVDTFTVLTSTAHKDGLKTMSDLKQVNPLTYAGYPACPTRITCLLGMKQIYGLNQIKFIPIGNISVYTLLDQGKAVGGDGFSTDPAQLNHKKYTALADDKHIFGFQNVAPVVKASLLKGSNGMLLESSANAVSAKLTLAAMQAMNKAYYVDKATPQQIAHGFLAANGLLTK